MIKQQIKYFNLTNENTDFHIVNVCDRNGYKWV